MDLWWFFLFLGPSGQAADEPRRFVGRIHRWKTQGTGDFSAALPARRNLRSHLRSHHFPYHFRCNFQPAGIEQIQWNIDGSFLWNRFLSDNVDLIFDGTLNRRRRRPTSSSSSSSTTSTPEVIDDGSAILEQPEVSDLELDDGWTFG